MVILPAQSLRMIRGLILALVGIIIMKTGLSQKSPVKFGHIPMEDMEMTVYDKDSSAGAVVLVDYGITYYSLKVGRNYTSPETERHVRIKILSKSALSQADITIPLFGLSAGGMHQVMTDLKASTFNLDDGKIVETKLDGAGVFSEELVKGITLRKFTFPNVGEGSVLEYSYKISGPTNLSSFDLQKTIPVRYSEFWAIVDDRFIIAKSMSGYLKPLVYEEKLKQMTGYSAKSYHWVLEDIPAIKPEPMMPNLNDYKSKIDFTLLGLHLPGQPIIDFLGSWDTIIKELLNNKNFGKAVENSGFLKEITDKVISGIADPMKQVEAIHDYVSHTIEWDGQNSVMAGDLENVLEHKRGASADLNFIMAGMLFQAGFLVDMIVTSTRDHGFIHLENPSMKQLNYTFCVARVNGVPMLLDATDKYLPMTLIPVRCLNEQGLMISKLTPGWVDLESTTKSKRSVSAEFELKGDGELTGQLLIASDGYQAGKVRKEYETMGEEAYKKNIVENTSMELEKSEFSDFRDRNLVVKELHTVSIREHAAIPLDVIYLSPFVHSKEDSNPFTASTRVFPVYFDSPFENVYYIKYTLPPGYFVDELPKSRILKLPENAARFTFNTTQVSNIVSVTCNLQINKCLFLPDEYPDLREFYKQVVAAQNEQIVIKRKP
jgi:hypothetical protein